LNFFPVEFVSKGLGLNPQEDVELLWNQSFFPLGEALSTILPKK